jgi:hypothetical protein
MRVACIRVKHMMNNVGVEGWLEKVCYGWSSAGLEVLMALSVDLV